MSAKVSLIREIITTACRRSSSPVRTTCNTPFSTTPCNQCALKNMRNHQSHLQSYLNTNQKKCQDAACQFPHLHSIAYSFESDPDSLNPQSPIYQQSRNGYSSLKKYYPRAGSPIQARIKTTPHGLVIEVSTTKDDKYTSTRRTASPEVVKMQQMVKEGSEANGLEFRKLSVADVRKVDREIMRKKPKKVEHVGSRCMPRVLQKTDKFQVTHESQHYSMAARLEQLQPSKLTNFATVNYMLVDPYN